MLELVASTPGALGYVLTDNVTGNVAIISVY